MSCYPSFGSYVSSISGLVEGSAPRATGGRRGAGAVCLAVPGRRVPDAVPIVYWNGRGPGVAAPMVKGAPSKRPERVGPRRSLLFLKIAVRSLTWCTRGGGTGNSRGIVKRSTLLLYLRQHGCHHDRSQQPSPRPRWSSPWWVWRSRGIDNGGILSHYAPASDSAQASISELT